MSEWHTVVSAPKDGAEFLALNLKENLCFVARYYTRGDSHSVTGFTGFRSTICDCCHDAEYACFDLWTPLPSLPERAIKTCGNSTLRCDHLDESLMLKTYTQMGRSVSYKIDFCPFCGEKK